MSAADSDGDGGQKKVLRSMIGEGRAGRAWGNACWSDQVSIDLAWIEVEAALGQWAQLWRRGDFVIVLELFTS